MRGILTSLSMRGVIRSTVVTAEDPLEYVQSMKGLDSSTETEKQAKGAVKSAF